MDEENPNLTGAVKNRYIDPLVQVKDGLRRVSQLYPDFAHELAAQQAKLENKKIPLRIVASKKTVQKAGISSP